jgi:hypothetical protein
LLGWACIAGLFLAIGDYARTKGWPLVPEVYALIGIGLVGYAQFYLFWSYPLAAKGIVAVLAGIGISTLLRHCLGTNRESYSGDSAPQLLHACVLWLLAAGFLLSLSMIGDDGSGAWSINGRFSPVRWSSDNQIPGLVAHALTTGKHETLAAMLPWTIADRPPLAYGLHASYQTLADWVMRGSDKHLAYSVQTAIGMLLNTLWIVFVALTLQRHRPRGNSPAIVATLVLAPFLLFNSVYTWPKLLSGTFGLAAAILLLGLGKHDRKLREDDHALVAAAALSALAMLTHGAAAFGIIASLLLAAVVRGFPSIRGGAVAATVALALLIPWSLWQHAVSPPGNALVKQAFAGTFGFGESHLGVVETILRSYGGLTFGDWLRMKVDLALTMSFGLRNTCGLNEAGVSYSLIDRLRLSDFYYPLPSLNFFVLGFVAIASQAIKRRNDATANLSRLWAAFGLTTLALTVLLAWQCGISHHQSYQAMLALHVGLALALLGSGTIGRIVLAAAVLYSAAVWVFEPLDHLPRLDAQASISTFAIAVLWGVAALRAHRRPGARH